jgi:hypothetical protein
MSSTPPATAIRIFKGTLTESRSPDLPRAIDSTTRRVSMNFFRVSAEAVVNAASLDSSSSIARMYGWSVVCACSAVTLLRSRANTCTQRNRACRSSATPGPGAAAW